MKANTIIKLGSLAFGVAQDEKVRELLKMAHKGAKRRGWYDAPIVPPPYESRRRPFHPGPYRPW